MSSPPLGTAGHIAVIDPTNTYLADTANVTSLGITVSSNNIPALSQENNAGNVVFNLIELNSNNNITLDTGRLSSFVGFGSSASGHSRDSLLMTNGALFFTESWDFGVDIRFIGDDYQNNWLAGGIDLNAGSLSAGSQSGDLYLTVQSNQQIRFESSFLPILTLQNGRTIIPAGGAIPPGNHLKSVAGVVPASVGGVIYDILTAVSTPGTGALETLLTIPIPGSAFQNIGDKVLGEDISFTCVASVTANRQIEVSFAGTTIFNSGTSTTTSNGICSLRIMLMYTAAGTVVATVTPYFPGFGATVDPQVTSVTGLTLTAVNNIVIAAESSGTGAANSDITLNAGGSFQWLPAAVVYGSPLNLAPVIWIDAANSAVTGAASGASYANTNRTTLATNSSNVEIMLDRSWNGINVSNPFAIYPVYSTGLQNSLPGIVFNGSSEFLLAQFNNMLNMSQITQPFTIYLVGTILSTPSGGKGCLLGTGNGNDGLIYNHNFNEFQPTFGNNTGTGPTISQNTPYVFKVVANGSSSTWNVNGGTSTTGNLGTDVMSYCVLGQVTNLTAAQGGTQFLNFNFFEALVFDYAITDSSAADVAIEAYLGTKWNIAT